MEPEDPEEARCPGFGPPWASLTEVFRQLYEQDTTGSARELLRLDPLELVIMHAWESRNAEWMALRAN